MRIKTKAIANNDKMKNNVCVCVYVCVCVCVKEREQKGGEEGKNKQKAD